MTEITYRKTKSGEWVAYGPASEIRQGCQVAITRSGTPIKECRWVESVGRPFMADGVEMVYGYLQADASHPKAPQRNTRPAQRAPRASWPRTQADYDQLAEDMGHVDHYFRR